MKRLIAAILVACASLTGCSGTQVVGEWGDCRWELISVQPGAFNNGVDILCRVEGDGEPEIISLFGCPSVVSQASGATGEIVSALLYDYDGDDSAVNVSVESGQSVVQQPRRRRPTPPSVTPGPGPSRGPVVNPRNPGRRPGIGNRDRR